LTDKIAIGRREALPPAGEAREFELGERMICVANVNGDYSALDNVCPHRGGPLGQGFLEGEKLVCPWHGWQFNAKTGAVEHAPDQKIAMYPLTVEGDEVFVEIP
jgi:nitrite reductase (NADH) small subunit